MVTSVMAGCGVRSGATIPLHRKFPSLGALKEKFGNRVFFTPKKMGAQTAEANINAGIAAARQSVGYLKDGIEKFKVNK